MRQSILSFISIIMFLVCGIACAQQVVNPAQTTTSQRQLSVEQQAILDANFDVDQQVNAMNWFLAGVCCHVYALPYVVLHTPQVPPARLLGKSPDYILAYTTEYQQKAKNKKIATFLPGVGVFVLAAIVALSGVDRL